MPYVDNAGVRIHYEVEGHGPTLVLQHGFTDSLLTWYEYGYVDALARDHQVILIDARGHVRHVQFGEGDYDKTEAAIRALLRDAGAKLGGDARPDRTFDPATRATPETYLGLARAEAYIVPPAAGTTTYVPAAPDRIPANQFSLGGTWTLSQESARAGAMVASARAPVFRRACRPNMTATSARSSA